MGSALSFTCTANGKHQIQLEEFLKIENEIKTAQTNSYGYKIEWNYLFMCRNNEQ